MSKKEYEFIVDHEFIKERNKVLDKQIAFLKSKGYEMGKTYFEWFKEVGKRGWVLQQCIDLSWQENIRKCYVYLGDVILETTNDLKRVQDAFARVMQDYIKVMNIGGKEIETEKHDL